MIAAYIALFISILCLIILSILLIKFKKLFSTDNILKKVQDLMEKRIKEIDTITYRDAQLIRETSKNVHEQMAQAEATMNKYQEAIQRLRKLIAQSEQISIGNLNESEIADYPKYTEKESESDYEGLSENEINFRKELKSYENIDSQNKMDFSEFNKIGSKIQKSDSLENVSDIENLSEINKPRQSTISPEDSRNQIEFDYSKLVKNRPKPSLDKIPKRQKQSFNDDVRILFNSGYNMEEIAKHLSCSTTEVQYVLDLGL